MNEQFVNFMNWLFQQFKERTSQLDYSNQFLPWRVHVETIDLSTARDASNPYKIPVQFKAARVVSVYSYLDPNNLTPVTSNPVDGFCKLTFDYQTIGAIANGIALKQNSSFQMDSLVSGAFITNDVQLYTKIKIEFYVDLNFQPGNTDTTVSNTVSVQDTGYDTISNFNQSGQAAGNGQVVINSTPTDFTIPANPNRAGIWLNHLGSNSTSQAGWCWISTGQNGDTPWNNAGTFQAVEPAAIALCPGDSLFIPTKGIVYITFPSDANANFGYVPGPSLIEYFEVNL